MSMELDLDLQHITAEVSTNRRVKSRVQTLADQLFRNIPMTTFSLLIVVLSLALVHWNVSRLSVLDELAKLEVQEYRLSDQLDDLEFRLQNIDFDRLSAEIEDQNNRVFQGFPNLSAWAESLNAQADLFGLDFSYSVGKPHPSPVPDVLEVPMILKLQAGNNQRNESFINATSFVETILRDHWHIDVLATEAVGDSNGLTAMSIDAQVWVRDRFGFVELTSISEPVNSPYKLAASG